MPEAPPRNIAMEIATALTRADAQSLAAIGFELLASLGKAETTIAQLQEARDAKRLYDRDYHKSRRTSRTMSSESGDSPAFSPGPPFSPPTSPSSSSARDASWQPAEEAKIAARLATDAGRNALTAVLAKCGDKAGAVAEVKMILDGGRPRVSGRVEHVELALQDYAGNETRWNAALFRSYVQRAARGDDPPPDGGPRRRPSSNAGAQMVANILGGGK